MRKSARERAALAPLARSRGRTHRAHTGALTSVATLPGRRPLSDAAASQSHAGAPHGVMLTLPARPAAGIAVLEPVELTPRPVVDGTLALLEEPAVALESTPRIVPMRHHILIVEDDPRTADVVRNALELEGEPDWGIEVAGEGHCALESALRTPPDVVLLDVRLPGLDGGEVYRRLRTSRSCGHTKVLFLSAGTPLDLHLRGIDDGVLLRKPFEVPTLLTLVRALLAD